MSPLRNTAPAPTQPRHMARVATALGLAVAAGVTSLVTACADGPTAPPASPSAAAVPAQAFTDGPHLGKSSAPIPVDLAITLTPAVRDSAIAVVVQPGGTRVAAPGGATVTFPAGFVARPRQFTITRKAGAAIGYDFEPSGTFSKPVTLTVGIEKIKVKAGAGALQGAYVRDWSAVDAETATAEAEELVPTTIATNGKTATLTLSHFSGYLLSTGRSKHRR